MLNNLKSKLKQGKDKIFNITKKTLSLILGLLLYLGSLIVSLSITALSALTILLLIPISYIYINISNRFSRLRIRRHINKRADELWETVDLKDGYNRKLDNCIKSTHDSLGNEIDVIELLHDNPKEYLNYDEFFKNKESLDYSNYKILCETLSELLEDLNKCVKLDEAEIIKSDITMCLYNIQDLLVSSHIFDTGFYESEYSKKLRLTK
jgi:hypothetical protein